MELDQRKCVIFQHTYNKFFFFSFPSFSKGQPPHWDRKRKRTHSFVSHDAPIPGPSVPQRTLENRLSQPESKKARKRRRKAERQALEDARLNWLNGPSPFASGVPILPPRSWSSDVQMYGGYPPSHSADHASLLKSGLITRSTPPLSSYTVIPGPDDFTLYDNYDSHSVSPPPPSSRWVSSMAKAAASNPIDPSTEEHDTQSQWSPSSSQMPLPPPLPSSLPPLLPPNAPNNPSRLSVSTLPKPVEHHALPLKPPPPQPIQTTIGMKPDQDPNSKHGIFQLTSATKEAGTDVKKKGPLYMPNPARTLVMEQLPKTHRHPDFINNWSKSACGAHPVHMFIDGPGGKALIEFATAELARKAWASPKLGPPYNHQVKSKAREDLIKVWWYRVDGVGAGSGVGEIEEGEIEGDAIEKEVDQPFRRETKKEKKARLAKEREEKRVKRELDLRLVKERHALQQLQVEPPIHSMSSFAVPETQRALTPYPISPPWSPALVQGLTQHLPTASEVSSGGPMEWEKPPPAMGDNWMGSLGASTTWTTEADDLDDYESDMEIDVYEPHPVVQPLPLHSSLPPRPAPSIVAPLPRVAVHRPPPFPPPPPPSPPTDMTLHSSRPVYGSPIPEVAPSPPPPPIIHTSESSSSSSTPSPTVLPSEPRAMKNVPTKPSFTKRALLARQKELEERIAKSKLELAERRAVSKPATPISSVQLADNLIPVKPSMDLGEKQAMEDRLRKLVLQSQRARGKTGAAANNSNGASNVSASTTAAPGDVSSISLSTSTSSSSSSSSAPSPAVPSNQRPLDQLTTVTVSAHNFSLEDLAVSFITQTIETIKSQPAPSQTQTPTSISVRPSNKPVSTQSNNNNTTKLELAAKQKQLEQHIMESKNLMTKLAQARTKEEKDSLLKAMREMTRSFEEGNQSKTATTTTTTTIMKPKTIWPGSHEDAGVLILSDSDSDESEED
ncbi:hypothetical protein BYT27DRAFT_6956865 [Phlegmacium glaucopus]|nr:hypothetical protein BYT27DRAFT_6956865 [Phlegmacium glaucopus]